MLHCGRRLVLGWRSAHLQHPCGRTFASKRDFYEVLGVKPTASQEEIKKAYRREALKWHPDRHPTNKAEAERRFKDISEAWHALQDKNSRAQYDFAKAHGNGYTGGGGPGPFGNMTPEQFMQQFGEQLRKSGFGSGFGGFPFGGFAQGVSRGSANPFSGFGGGFPGSGEAIEIKHEYVTKDGKQIRRTEAIIKDATGKVLWRIVEEQPLG
eukprot:TRINITY_DN81706_c0_g1_i1.p1 TRINITY_DN81706_c0_g1~~TRINITY_DN81706_c0_g1_i1.p1  ORF type:complete len:210 (+),score=25.61 TRINITY_DN81706_c0_g1_i1:54-683(+)